jgi:ribosomal protein L21E
MAAFGIGDRVRVEMPKGVNKRGVVGISVMYTTWPEARFDGATGEVVEVNPRGPYGMPLYLVNFGGHENRVAIPWQSQWFREEWLVDTGDRRPRQPAKTGELAAGSGWGATTTGESS